MAMKYLDATGLQYFWDSIKITDTQYLKLASELASAYDVTADYFVGEFCIYNGYVWECNTAISGGEAWTSSHWTQIGAAT